MCAATNHIMVTIPIEFSFEHEWIWCECECVYVQVLRSVSELLTLFDWTMCWILVKVNKSNKSSEKMKWLCVAGIESVWFGLAWLGSRCSFSVDLNHFIRFASLCVAHTVQTENQRTIEDDTTMALPLIKILPIITRDQLELHFKIRFKMKFPKRDHSFPTIFTIQTEYKLSFTVNVAATLKYLGPKSYLIRFDVCVSECDRCLVRFYKQLLVDFMFEWMSLSFRKDFNFMEFPNRNKNDNFFQ